MSYKPPPTKDELRRQLRQEIGSYLDHGGEVSKIPNGQSGREDNSPLKTVLFDKPKETRTYVNELVANIEERRRGGKPPATRTIKASKGHYKTILDDFGEPIRKVWVDQ
jgi:hypothetical protein